MSDKQTSPDSDANSGLPIPIDGGANDLGDDVNRDMANRDSALENASNHAGVDPGSGLPIPINPGEVDLGSSAVRGTGEGS